MNENKSNNLEELEKISNQIKEIPNNFNPIEGLQQLEQLGTQALELLQANIPDHPLTEIKEKIDTLHPEFENHLKQITNLYLKINLLSDSEIDELFTKIRTNFIRLSTQLYSIKIRISTLHKLDTETVFVSPEQADSTFLDKIKHSEELTQKTLQFFGIDNKHSENPFYFQSTQEHIYPLLIQFYEKLDENTFGLIPTIYNESIDYTEPENKLFCKICNKPIYITLFRPNDYNDKELYKIRDIILNHISIYHQDLTFKQEEEE